jgi:hypothetical protein
MDHTELLTIEFVRLLHQSTRRILANDPAFGNALQFAQFDNLCMLSNRQLSSFTIIDDQVGVPIHLMAI